MINYRRDHKLSQARTEAGLGIHETDEQDLVASLREAVDWAILEQGLPRGGVVAILEQYARDERDLHSELQEEQP